MIGAGLKWLAVSLFVSAAAASCGGSSETTRGSESHFLARCDESSCGAGLSCICGVCTRTCEAQPACDGLSANARCVESDDLPASASCAELSPAQGVCDAPCSGDAECAPLGAGFACSAGVCRTPEPEPELEPRCAAPRVAGDCFAAIPRYWHNPATRSCELFTYGGCGGNENNYATREDCVAACPPEPTDITSCTTSAECRLMNAGCCEACRPTLDDFVAVNGSYAAPFAPSLLDPEPLCGPAACEPCGLLPENAARGSFGARCEAGRCVVFDVRETDLVECSAFGPEGAPGSCRTRAGVGCCEPCDVMSSGLTAVSADVDLPAEIGCGEIGCPPCVPLYPPLPHAQCNVELGRCELTFSDTVL